MILLYHQYLATRTERMIVRLGQFSRPVMYNSTSNAPTLFWYTCPRYCLVIADIEYTLGVTYRTYLETKIGGLKNETTRA